MLFQLLPFVESVGALGVDRTDYEFGTAVLVENHLGADDLVTVENSTGRLGPYVAFLEDNGPFTIVLVLWVTNLS